MPKKPLVRGTVEYFKFTLDEETGQDLTGNTVQCAIEIPGTLLADFTWLDSTWDTGNIWRTASPITWSSANYPANPYGYKAWAKIVDSPETPLVDLGPVPLEET